METDKYIVTTVNIEDGEFELPKYAQIIHFEFGNSDETARVVYLALPEAELPQEF